jgi:hypothetical protein
VSVCVCVCSLSGISCPPFSIKCSFHRFARSFCILFFPQMHDFVGSVLLRPEIALHYLKRKKRRNRKENGNECRGRFTFIRHVHPYAVALHHRKLFEIFNCVSTEVQFTVWFVCPVVTFNTTDSVSNFVITMSALPSQFVRWLFRITGLRARFMRFVVHAIFESSWFPNSRRFTMTRRSFRAIARSFHSATNAIIKAGRV